MSLADGEVAGHTDAVAGLTARPAVANESVVVTTGDVVQCFDPAEGSRRWAHPLSDVHGLALADDLVYASTGAAVVALRVV